MAGVNVVDELADVDATEADAVRGEEFANGSDASIPSEGLCARIAGARDLGVFAVAAGTTFGARCTREAPANGRTSDVSSTAAARIPVTGSGELAHEQNSNDATLNGPIAAQRRSVSSE